MGRTLERLWKLSTLVWLGFAVGFFWGWPPALSVFDRAPGSPLSQEALSHLREAFVFSFVVIPPVIMLVMGWALEAAAKPFQHIQTSGAFPGRHPKIWYRG